MVCCFSLLANPDLCCIVQEELHEWFANCEMKQLVLSDVTGPSTQDVGHFPGYRIEGEHAAVTEETSHLPQT